MSKLHPLPSASIGPLNRDAKPLPPDLTVATLVVDAGRFLMVEERVHGEVLFNQPAGHVHHAECLLEAAARETLEETGYRVRLEHFVACGAWQSARGTDYLRLTFAAALLNVAPLPVTEADIVGSHWLTRREIAALGPRLRSPLILIAIDNWLSGVRQDLAPFRRQGWS